MADESLPIPTGDGNVLIFWEQAVENGNATQKSGRAMFDRVLMVRVTAPSSKSDVTYEVDREYPEEYPHPTLGRLKTNKLIYDRYGKIIEEYKKRGGASGIGSGTPLEKWALMDTRTVALCKHHLIYTVEALAGLSDAQMATLGMGARALVQKAKDWIASAKDSALSMQLANDKRVLEARLEQMQTQIDELTAGLDAVPPDAQAMAKDAVIRRRGRPPKVHAA